MFLFYFVLYSGTAYGSQEKSVAGFISKTSGNQPFLPEGLMIFLIQLKKGNCPIENLSIIFVRFFLRMTIVKNESCCQCLFLYDLVDSLCHVLEMDSKICDCNFGCQPQSFFISTQYLLSIHCNCISLYSSTLNFSSSLFHRRLVQECLTTHHLVFLACNAECSYWCTVFIYLFFCLYCFECFFSVCIFSAFVTQTVWF